MLGVVPRACFSNAVQSMTLHQRQWRLQALLLDEQQQQQMGMVANPFAGPLQQAQPAGGTRRYKPHPGTMCHGRGQHMTNKCWVQSFHHGCAGGGASWISAAQGNSQMLEYVHFDMPYLETLSGDDLDL
eukprot:jgi/Astpho2/1272/Aster-07116